MRDKISLIMPSYNRAWCINRAIKSVINQTYKNWELIIVDDGSTDNTKEIIKPYLRDKRIRYTSLKKNQGVNFARNKGLDISKGDIIALFDSDDELKTETLEIISKEFGKIWKRKDIGILIFNCEDIKGHVIGNGPKDRQIITLKDEIMGKKFSGEKFRIIKGSLIHKDKFRFPSLRGQNESIFWFEIGEKYNSLCVNKSLRIYHTEHDDRLTGSGQILSKAKYQKTLYEILLRRFGNYYINYNQHKLAYLLLEKGINEIISRDLKEGRKSVLKSIKYNPKKIVISLFIFSLSFLPNKFFINLAIFGHKFKEIIK